MEHLKSCEAWESLLGDITAYIDHLKGACGLQVTLHLIEPYFHPCLKHLLKYNIHSNALCTYAKQSFPLWRECIDRQVKVIAQAADGPYFGMCWVGVCEYVVPIRDSDGNKPMFISVSGYAAQKEQACRRIRRVCEQYDLDEQQMLSLYDEKLNHDLPGLEAICTLLEPLSWMLTLLLERISYPALRSKGQSDDSDYLYALALQHIDRNFASPLSLQMLSEQLRYSQSHISRLFNRKAGMSLKAYINYRRIEVARQYLANTHMSIQEIAYAVGFSDANYFSTAFRGICGESPRTWRKAQQEDAGHR